MVFTLIHSLCEVCKHLHEDPMRCDAFPDGIPWEIRMMRVDHRQPQDGDHGIQFEPKDDKPETLEHLSLVKLHRWELDGEAHRRHAKVRDFVTITNSGRFHYFRRLLYEIDKVEDMPAWAQKIILDAEAKSREARKASRSAKARKRKS